MLKSQLTLTFALIFHIISYIIIFKRIEPYYIHFYAFIWWSYIILMDSIYSMKNGRYLILKNSIPLLIIISAGFWCIFELINLRIQNWFYINLPKETIQRHIGYVLSYGTVIPALYVTKEIVHSIIGELKVIKAKALKHYPIYAISIGFVTLVLTLIIPEIFFGLAWVSVGFIFDGYNYKLGNRSFAGDIEKGYLGSFLASMIAGLLCGILWEFWNNWAIAKWIYTVPFFEDLKLFEMPVLGYIGFIVFGLETITFVNFLEGLWSKKINVMIITLLMVCICVLTFTLIDRHTVFSRLARLDDIDFIEKDRLDAMRNEGIKTSYKIDKERLSEKEREYLDLMHLKGLGMENLSRLRQNNINNIYGLSTLDEKILSNIINEKNMRRVRVYLKAAKKNAPKMGRSHNKPNFSN